MRIRVPVLLLAATVLVASDYSPRKDLDAGRYLKALAEADAQLRQNPSDALAFAAKSQALTALVRLPEAMATARRSVELQPNLPEAYLARAMAKAGLAVQQRSLGSLSGITGAMDDLREAVALDPRFVPAWMTLGVAYETLPGFLLGGSTRKALACAETVKQLDPAKGWLLEGTILSMEGRWPEARGAFGSGLAAAPRDPDLVYGYLDALGSRKTRNALGPVEQKRQLAQEARRLLPGIKEFARAVCAVCDAFLDADLGEEAWATAVAALPGSSAPSLIHLEFGKISARSGVHRTEGLNYLEQVLREPLEGGSGGYGTAHWRKGQILRDLGRKAEAGAAARAALALDPKDGRAADLLKELNLGSTS